MNTYARAGNTNNIELSIQYINDISVYAKRVTVCTLHTAGVLNSSIKKTPYAKLMKSDNGNVIEKSYLDRIANQVERFGEKLDEAIARENAWIRTKDSLSQIKGVRNLLKDWKPLALITELKAAALFDWYQFRIDRISKAYMNQLIEQIQFMEVQNV